MEGDSRRWWCWRWTTTVAVWWCSRWREGIGRKNDSGWRWRTAETCSWRKNGSGWRWRTAETCSWRKNRTVAGVVRFVVVVDRRCILGFQLNVILGKKKRHQQHQLSTCGPLMHTELRKRVGGSARPTPS